MLSGVERAMLNYFHLFKIPESFDIDIDALGITYRHLQSQYHPDRFVGADEAAQRQSLLMASNINEGWRTLSSPVARAGHLLALAGEATGEERTCLPPEFLMTQMEWRERLADAATSVDLETLTVQLRGELAALGNRFAAELANGNRIGAHRLYSEMQFFHKLIEEARRLIERFDEV